MKNKKKAINHTHLEHVAVVGDLNLRAAGRADGCRQQVQQPLSKRLLLGYKVFELILRR